jgi:two-component system phosphate regulon sensor histidine kinase PhoR
MIFSARDGLIAGTLVVGGLVAGAILDAFGLGLFLAALCWIGLQQRELLALHRWSRHPLRRPENRLDSWQSLSDRLYRSVRRSRQRTRRTLQTLGTMRAITNALPDAAVIIDVRGDIQNFNTAAQEMLRLKPSDQGNNLAALIRQPDVVRLIRGGREPNIVELASPFDESRRIEVRRIDLPAEHAMILVRDVTQLNRLLTMRQDFVANVSHELRTPLTVVVGYLETLANEDLDPETIRTLLHKMEAPTTRMRALVDDLLLLTRLEGSGRPQPGDLAKLDMGSIVRSCIAEARMLSEGRHRFQTDLDADLILLGVETEIYSACLNIITNAVRYSPDGGKIHITWARSADGACLAVTDEGMGIPTEHLQRITERFYRVDLAKSRVRGGTGLGLAIVKHVLKRHRAELLVDSTLGEGTTFRCVFPESQLAPRSQVPLESAQ